MNDPSTAREELNLRLDEITKRTMERLSGASLRATVARDEAVFRNNKIEIPLYARIFSHGIGAWGHG